MEEKEISVFNTSFLFTTMLKRTSRRFVAAAGTVFVLLLLEHFSSPWLVPQEKSSRVSYLPRFWFS